MWSMPESWGSGRGVAEAALAGSATAATAPAVPAMNSRRVTSLMCSEPRGMPDERTTNGSGQNAGMSEPGTWSRRTAWARTLPTPLRTFVRTETGSAAVLLAATVAALAWVNIAPGSYAAFWDTPLAVRLGDWTLDQNLRAWVNNG